MYSAADKTTLCDHGVPVQLIQAVGDIGLPKPLCFGFSSPDFQSARELETSIPALNGLIPIFGQNGDAIVGFVPRTNQFIRFYYEDGDLGDSAVEIMGTGYVQFASKLILECEAAGLSEHFESLVDFLQFPQGPALRRLLDADPYNDESVEEFHTRLGQS